MLTDRILLERIEKWLSPIYWTDINLQSALYGPVSEVIDLKCFEPEGLSRPLVGEVISQRDRFREVQIGSNYSPSWSTKWFTFQVSYPELFRNQCVALRWDSNSEALLYDKDGRQIQAFTGGGGGDRRDLCFLTDNALPGEIETFYVEMACNEMFGNGQNGMIRPPDPNKSFCLSTVNVVVVNKSAHALYWDLVVMCDLVKSLPENHPTVRRLLRLMNEIVNVTNLKDSCSINNSHQLAIEFFRENGSKVNHDIFAFGHCHIDTAWLWPYAETRRKVARSWATQLHLLKSYPDYRFVASQTVQYEWLLEDHPQLFERVRQSVKLGQFIPVGGTYVEFDANIPSGESMVRQFLYGMGFLKQHFDVVPQIFWLPDTFGYSSQLPQIMKGFGIQYFLSQKLSWNLINKFPHNTLEWRGLDGSSVIAHFPPADTYGSEANPSDLIKSVENNKSKMSNNRSILLFGHGDGGGGPAISHLEKLKRLVSCESISRIHMNSTPDEFFRQVQHDFLTSSRDSRVVPHPVWSGELYLELHQGTLTSQAKIKAQNRTCESLLRALEALHVLCLFAMKKRWIDCTEESIGYLNSVSSKLLTLWKDTLLNQFHDVIPGSSIAEVYRDSDRMLTNVIQTSQKEICRLMQMLNSHSTEKSTFLFNPCGISRAHLGLDFESNSPTLIKLKPFAFGAVPAFVNDFVVVYDPEKSSDKVYAQYIPEKRQYILGNQIVEAIFSESGSLLSFIDKRIDPPREILQSNFEGQISPGNHLFLFDDVPFYWDAWDIMPYYSMTGRSLNGSQDSRIQTKSSLKFSPIDVCLQVTLENWSDNSDSKIKMEISLHADSPMLSFLLDIDWYEAHKLLKVQFPLDIQSNVARYETQFGFTERPTHCNHSTDASMFETCGHRYASLSETGYGVALLNDCKYGYSCRESTLSLSLLRAPKSPDPDCDMGHHVVRYALFPHRGSLLDIQGGLSVVSQATVFNAPLCQVTSSQQNNPQISTMDFSSLNLLLANGLIFLEENNSLIMDSIKIAENNRNSQNGSQLQIIVRFYESLGSRGRAILNSPFDISSVSLVSLNESYIRTLPLSVEDSMSMVRFPYSPFQIITLLIEFSL